MIEDALKNAGDATQTRRARLRDASSRRVADTSPPRGADVDTEEAYPAEFMPVGDPRPQHE
jgi:hypothetical protein